LEVADHDGLFLVSADELKYICTNVIKVMRDVLEPCRAVIFCGGTMSPISETILQLIPEDFQSRTLSKAVDHIISPSNVNISLLATGPSGAKFNFSFETRFDCKMIKDLGITLLNYSKIIPAGVVVFFASFSYMEYVLDTWLYQNVMANLSDIKEVYIYMYIRICTDIRRYLLKKNLLNPKPCSPNLKQPFVVQKMARSYSLLWVEN
jgi:hypothetical protein